MVEQPDEPLLVEKASAWITMPQGLYDELLANSLGAPLIIGTPLTDEERAEMRRQHDAEMAAVQADYEVTRAACAGQPAALAVLDLHKPHDHYGPECEVSENDELPTDWPCSTFTAIRDALKV